jgi:hypothetical protein
MKDKAVITIIFMYALSFSLLGGQYILEPFGITMTNAEGVEIRSSLLSIIDTDNLNTVTENLVTINGTQAESDPVSVSAMLVVEILELLTGTYIFNLLFLFLVPPIFVYGMIILYSILLFLFVIPILRGIF